MRKSSARQTAELPTLETIKREQARRHLGAFLELDAGGKWVKSRYLDHLTDALERVEAAVCEGRGARIIICLPPRHTKSEIFSKKGPAWILGRNPDWEIILTSYDADLALDHSRIARDTFAEWGQALWDVRLAKDSKAVNQWHILGHRGGMKAAGVGGSITGHGAHIAIVDDPFKNWEEASSPTIREKVWNWYKTTLRTRLAPGGAIILVTTRWHEDDLVGKVLKDAKAEGEQWEVISLPAEAEENDPIGRQPGEWLCPERFRPEEYLSLKRTLGSHLWAALYQQRPSPEEGGIIKRGWWKYYKQAPAKFDEVIQSWDCAFKDLSTSDYVVGQVWGRKAADKFLLDQVRAKMDFPVTIAAVRSLSAKWPTARAKLVEDKANGPAVIATLKREIPGLIAVEPEGGKVVRARAVSPDIEAGNVYLPDPSIAPWIHDFVEECSAFPNAAHDDQVDAMTQALNRLQNDFEVETDHIDLWGRDDGPGNSIYPRSGRD